MTQRRRFGSVMFALVSSLMMASCSSLPPPRLEPNQTLQHGAMPVTISGGSVEIHLARRFPTRANGPLVVFASGDGGWFGTAVGMFETVATAGYPVVGVSYRALLRGLRTPGHPLSAARLLGAYREIIATAQRAFNLPASTRVILAGWSRGASISVIVGAEHPVAPVAGVVAIGLAADENLNVDLESDDDEEPGAGARHGMDTYATSRSVGGRLAVIQSSGDGYLPADRARALFGADTTRRRFYEVPASNHRFTGGTVAFRRHLHDALEWISTDEESHQ